MRDPRSLGRPGLLVLAPFEPGPQHPVVLVLVGPQEGGQPEVHPAQVDRSRTDERRRGDTAGVAVGMARPVSVVLVMAMVVTMVVVVVVVVAVVVVVVVVVAKG